MVNEKLRINGLNELETKQRTDLWREKLLVYTISSKFIYHIYYSHYAHLKHVYFKMNLTPQH